MEFANFNLHIERKLDFGLKVTVVNLEESVHKFSEVDELSLAEIKNIHKSFSNDSWQVAIREHCNLVDSLALVIALGDKILVNILEVWNGDVLLELFILEDCVIYELKLRIFLLGLIHLVYRCCLIYY